MHSEEFPKFMKELFDRQHDLFLKKSADYNGSESFVELFERVSSRSGTTVEQSMMNLIGVKYERISSLLLQEGKSNFESLDDSIVDLLNYLMMFKYYISLPKKEMSDGY